MPPLCTSSEWSARKGGVFAMPSGMRCDAVLQLATITDEETCSVIVSTFSSVQIGRMLR
jgi:hypothetical protein